jgi:Flp pilus assembly protein TadG
MKHILSRLLHAFSLRRARALGRDQRGISAVEFALIAPLMLLLYLGSVELSVMMRMDRKVTATASALGDLTARLSVASDNDMREMFNAATLMLDPHPATAARMRITSIIDIGEDLPVVAWSDAYGQSAFTPGTTITVPDGIVPPFGSVIMAEVEIDHVSSTGLVLTGSKRISETFYLRPRRVITIDRNTSGGGGSAFGPGT